MGWRGFAVEYICLSRCFFFNDTATTEIYTLSLHDALPISLHASQDLRRNETKSRSGKGAAEEISSEQPDARGRAPRRGSEAASESLRRVANRQVRRPVLLSCSSARLSVSASRRFEPIRSAHSSPRSALSSATPRSFLLS